MFAAYLLVEKKSRWCSEAKPPKYQVPSTPYQLPCTKNQKIMAIIHPFKGFRPAKALAARVASRPYDVLNRTEAKAEAAGNPHSYLRIVRSEIDLPDALSPYDTQVYAKAKSTFEQWVSEGVLVQDETPHLYVYAQTMNGKQQIGIVAGTSIDDYQNNVIKKHEFTRPEKEQDRISHITHTRLHSGPVLMAYPHVSAIDTIIAHITAQTPENDFTSPDGIQHTLWLIANEGTIKQLVRLFDTKVPAIYIADGHHRAASSTKVGLAQRAENPNATGEEEYNFFLSVLFPDNQLSIIDYNRVVKDLNGLHTDEFLIQIANNFEVVKTPSIYKPEGDYTFGMYLDKQWYQLTAKAGTYDTTHPIKSLAISVLSDNLLDPILGIKDQRTDKRIDFVGGIRGLEELERRVDNGEMKVAFAIYPVSIAQLLAVADSGDVMPPKSTWFEPKLRSGLVTHQF